MFKHQRLSLRIEITRLLNAQDLCVASVEPLEPHVPWDERFLRYCFGCYQTRRHPLAGAGAPGSRGLPGERAAGAGGRAARVSLTLRRPIS